MILDDPYEGEVGQSFTRGWFERVFASRLESEVPMVIVMSRIHEDDVAGDIEISGEDYPVLRLEHEH
jgi:hypothetical protein